MKHSTPKSAIFCHPSDDTIPEAEAGTENRTETGETIQSSAFIDLNCEEREKFQVQDWEALEEGLLDFGGEAASREQDDQGMVGNEGAGAVSREVDPGRYPRRTGTERSYHPHEEEDDKDVYDFQDDSFDDKEFVLPPQKLAKVFSPSKPVVEISRQKKAGPTAKEMPVRTPPEIVKARRDPDVEEIVRGVGGRTPDEAAGNKYGSFNKELLSTLVHKLAKSKHIDLRKEPLKPGFFKDLVNLYGDVSNTNSLKLAPYKSHQYIMRKWREIYCTKKVMSARGNFQADVHLFEDQNSKTPCRLCSDHSQREDPRDQLLQKVFDQVNAAQGRQGVVKEPASAGQMGKTQADKALCPDCDRLVCNVKRHQSENCRANPKNLAECPRCKIMIVKRSLTEHLNGRLDKKTGAVINPPCKGEDSDKVKCPICGIMVKNLNRHTKERHPKKAPSAESSRLSDSIGVKRPRESATLGTSSDAKRQKQGVTPLPAKPGFQWSNVDILQLTDDLLFKLQQLRSMEDTGGVDQEQMVRLGQLFMKKAFGIEVLRAPFLVDTDGDCLSNTLSYIANPNQPKEMTAEGGTGLRQVVVGEVLDFIKEASMEALKPIQIAAAAVTANQGDWLTRDELLERLATYRNNGTWAGDLGDLMPHLYASFTNTPIFLIVYDSNQMMMIGYFINPSHVFNRPTLRTAASPVMHFQRHYEPLVVPAGFMEAWEAICESQETQKLAMAAIKVQLSEEDLRGLREEMRDATGATALTTGAVEQRQEGHNFGGNLAGD